MADKTEAAQNKINTATELGIIVKSQELVMLLSHIHDHAILREYALMQYNTAIRKRDKVWINHFRRELEFVMSCADIDRFLPSLDGSK